MATSQNRVFVGIDIAADTFTASTYAGPSAEGTEPATFTNDEDGFKVFAGWLRERGALPNGPAICMEATGVYAEALCHDLHGRGYRVAVEAPLRVQRAFKTSANKTDSVDSQQIAEYAFRFEDELPPWAPPEAIVEHVRVLLRTREQLTRDLVGKKNMLHTVRRKVVRTPLAEELLEESVGQIKVQIRRIQKEIQRLVRQSPKLAETMMLLRSIPGVGPVLSAHLLVTTNAFRREPTARQLAAHAGICPYEHQSGRGAAEESDLPSVRATRFEKTALPGGAHTQTIRATLRAVLPSEACRREAVALGLEQHLEQTPAHHLRGASRPPAVL